jgi:hypothetical protein
VKSLYNEHEVPSGDGSQLDTEITSIANNFLNKYSHFNLHDMLYLMQSVIGEHGSVHRLSNGLKRNKT